MSTITTVGATGFEPPKYIATLVASINDGAKAAQGSAFLFLLVGVYLVATAFSATDEDLLLGHTVTISQIGASLPVSFSFAIAPGVFVCLHIYALVRYDMLAANLRQFNAELEAAVPLEADRERCRHLLTNIEFIEAMTAPRSSPLYSNIWPWLFCVIVAAIPVSVLLLVQINALRYQSELITSVQRAWIALDLGALGAFFWRNRIGFSGSRAASRLRWGWIMGVPLMVMALNFAWLNLESAEFWVTSWRPVTFARSRQATAQ